MPRVRPRTVVLAVAALVVVVAGGGFAFFALTGGDAPAPASIPASAGPPASAPDGAYAIADGDDSYAGYRVREEYLSVGVRTAVGRTGFVSGAATVRGGRIVAARFTARLLGALHSDQPGRDSALETRGIETATYPTAAFALRGPVDLSTRPVAARGALTLHGVTAPVALRVEAARQRGGALIVAGSAPIRFKDYRIAAPSTAGVARVRDHGTLEFRLRLMRRG